MTVPEGRKPRSRGVRFVIASLIVFAGLGVCALGYMAGWPRGVGGGVMAAAILLSIRYWQRSRTYPRWCCQSCGYDRCGLGTDAPCPECGASA
ncbi:MAG TPA: hypothetical protein VD971_04445 [Phycisphaerales bacterium]|nr:hypothetical protein [Phycisphaerales bacterium]